jgi:mono/diheme cytochrome c family protein
MFSCGPRSGINKDKVENEAWCGTESISVKLDSSSGAGYKLFKQNCAVCHALSELKLTAVGLAGIVDRLPAPAEEYFVKFTLNNEKVYASGDAYARKLRENNVSPMPIFDSVLTEQNVRQIYKYLTNPMARQN